MPNSRRERPELLAALRLIKQQEALIDRLQAQIRRLQFALGQSNDALWQTFRLPPMLVRLLGMLQSMDVVPAEIIQSELGYASDPKIAILRLRRELMPWGIKISSARSRGYFLSEDMKARVRDIVNSEMARSVEEAAEAPRMERGRSSARARPAVATTRRSRKRA